MYGSVDEIQELRKERDEAVNLLTALLKNVEGYKSVDVDAIFKLTLGLKEWWVARKPKSEREQNLEKIIRLIQDCTHSPNDSAEYLAERILTALEQ